MFTIWSEKIFCTVLSLISWKHYMVTNVSKHFIPNSITMDKKLKIQLSFKLYPFLNIYVIEFIVNICIFYSDLLASNMSA